MGYSRGYSIPSWSTGEKYLSYNVRMYVHRVGGRWPPSMYVTVGSLHTRPLLDIVSYKRDYNR
jgi:hypothetical protein